MDLERTLSEVKQNNGHLSRRLSLIDEQLSDTLRQIEEEKKWLRDVKFTIRGVSSSDGTGTLDISWYFNTLKSDQQVYLLVGQLENLRNKNDISWRKISVKSDSGLFYTTQVELALKENYKFQIVAEGKEIKRSAQLNRYNNLNIHRELGGRFNLRARFRNDNNPQLELSFYNQLKNELIGYPLDGELLNLKSGTVEIYIKDNKKIDTIDLLQENKSDKPGLNHIEVEKYYKDFDSNIDSIKIKVKLEDGLGLTYSQIIRLREGSFYAGDLKSN